MIHQSPNYKIIISITLILLIIGVFHQTPADTLNLPIGQITVIRNGEVNRIRLTFDLSALNNKRVDYAEILIPHFLTNGRIVLEAWRLTSGNTNNYDSTYRVRFTAKASVNLPAALDITEFVKYWVDNGNNHGVLLKRPNYEGGSFRGELQSLRQALSNARLRVFFTKESE